MKIPTIAINWRKPSFTFNKGDTGQPAQVSVAYRFTASDLQLFPLKQSQRTEMLEEIVKVLTDQQKVPPHWTITRLPDQQAQIATDSQAWILRLTALATEPSHAKKAELIVDPLFVGPPKPSTELALIPKKQPKNDPVWNLISEKLSK